MSVPMFRTDFTMIDKGVEGHQRYGEYRIENRSSGLLVGVRTHEQVGEEKNEQDNDERKLFPHV